MEQELYIRKKLLVEIKKFWTDDVEDCPTFTENELKDIFEGPKFKKLLNAVAQEMYQTYRDLGKLDYLVEGKDQVEWYQEFLARPSSLKLTYHDLLH